MLYSQLVCQKVPLSFHDKCVTKSLQLLRWYLLIHSVVQRLDFIFIRGSLKVSTKASVSIVVTVLPIALTCTSVSLAKTVYISATYFFRPVCTEVSGLSSPKLLNQLV